MAQEIARPASTAIETTTDAKIVQSLRASSKLDIRVQWDKDDDNQPYMVLIVSPLPGADAEKALGHVKALMSPASSDRLTEALATIVTVCIRPSDVDDARVVVWTRRMLQALEQYPADIAFEMLNEWPKSQSGKFWPTENDIHTFCAKRVEFRARLERELESLNKRAQTPLPEGAKLAPEGGPVAEFVARVRAKFGDAYVKSWLSNITCAFTENVVLTTNLGSERLNRDVGNIATECGVKIAYDPGVTERFMRQP